MDFGEATCFMKVTAVRGDALACMTSHHMYEEARAPAVLMGAASSLGSGFTSRAGMAAQDDLADEMQMEHYIMHGRKP